MIHIKLNAGGKCQHVDFQLMKFNKKQSNNAIEVAQETNRSTVSI